MIDRAASADPATRSLLAAHPKVRSVEECANPGVDFTIGAWERAVEVANPALEVAGLVELIDNNPMVCADRMSVPDPLSTLALIAVGPLAWAGMILERPTIISCFAGEPSLLDRFLATAGWTEGATYHTEDAELGSVLAVSAMVEIATPADWSEIDDLYDERFGRSFFVRHDDESEWEPALVEGKPHAVYRMRYTPGDDRSLLTINALADENGKCGRGQVIHAMNVMAGFEESLGL